MGSKRFKGKACAYCGTPGASTTGDHVVAREFFLVRDRANLPQVPACGPCNTIKSELETYATAVLPIASRHDNADEYRATHLPPRLKPHVRRKVGFDEPARLVDYNGIIQPMHALRLDATRLEALMAMIVRGLFFYHLGGPLDPSFFPDVGMHAPGDEAALWASVTEFFPEGSGRVMGNLGRGTFLYEGAQSPGHRHFTVWRMFWHGGVVMHGENGAGASAWWVFTRPTPSAVAEASVRRD